MPAGGGDLEGSLGEGLSTDLAEARGPGIGALPGDRRPRDQDGSRRGPTIINERVKTIGGHLEVISAPGRGTRLEIRVPQEAHA